MAAQIRSLLPSASPPPPPSSRLPPFPRFDEAFPAFLSRSASGNVFARFSVLSTASSSPSFHSSKSVGSYEGLRSDRPSDRFEQEGADDGGKGGGHFTGSNGDGGDGGGGDRHGGQGNGGGDSFQPGGIFGAFVKGWDDRVRADPEFPFKVLMEEVVGVGAFVIGDMASRPNFGLNELDFVFSTIVVGSILNFCLMYMLAPTSVTASAAIALPSMFASCPPGHMFEQGAYTLLDRLGTFVYKGAVFGTVGFAAGLLGTTISNMLIGMRKRKDPGLEVQVKAAPTVLNAATWAIHMGLSSNLRYQVVNGLEFAMANALPTPLFKASVLCTRAANNVLGGMSFVFFARLTGSQKAEEPEAQTQLQMSALGLNEATGMLAEKPPIHLEISKEHNSNLVREQSATDVEP